MNKIDFVITWVDDKDREWQKSKQKCLGITVDEKKGDSIDADDIRYRDWDILRYWFRAVEKYAPWVNQIHFVTCGHLPQWLNTDAPKLHFVKHSDYIPKQYLPTFSSHPIELNFHRIKELSDKFVYFNDDFFLTSPVSPEDFFVNGLPCDALVETPIEFPVRELYNSIRINDVVFANKHFSRKEANRRLRKKRYALAYPQDAVKNMITSFLKNNYFFGLAIHHLPQAYLKSTLEEVWNVDYELLDTTSSHKFRDEKDVSQCVFKFWQLLNGNFHPYDKRKYGRLYKVGTQTEELCDAIQKQKYKYICINDSGVTEFDKTKKTLIETLEKVFPDKSSFEL